MSEMIEKVAEVLWNDEALRATGRPRYEPWSEVQGQAKEMWMRMARAAIQAMREPDKEMLEKGNDTIEYAVDTEGTDSMGYWTTVAPHAARDTWQAMIDAALASCDERPSGLRREAAQGVSPPARSCRQAGDAPLPPPLQEEG